MPHVFEKEHRYARAGDDPEDVSEQDPLKIYHTWKAPSRPFKKKDKAYYRTIAIIAVLLILITLLLQNIILIGVILSVAFVSYVLAFVPPEEVEYKISNQGITIANHFYFWGDLSSFWIIHKEEYKILNVLTKIKFPAQLIMLINNGDEEDIKRIVAKYLPYHEIPPQSFIDRWADRLQKYFPLEGTR